MNHQNILDKLIAAPAVHERVYRTAHWAVDTDLTQWARGRVPALTHGGLQLITGFPEAGKTFAALYLAAALKLDNPKLSVGYFTAPDLSVMMFEEKARYAKLQQYGCLIIDDLGTNPLGKTDWTALQWDALINRVYAACGILILTSNLGIDLIAEQYGERIASRFKEQGPGWCKAAPDEGWRSKAITGQWAERKPVMDTSEPFGPKIDLSGPEIIYCLNSRTNKYMKGRRGDLTDIGRQAWKNMPEGELPPDGVHVYTSEEWDAEFAAKAASK